MTNRAERAGAGAVVAVGARRVRKTRALPPTAPIREGRQSTVTGTSRAASIGRSSGFGYSAPRLPAKPLRRRASAVAEAVEQVQDPLKSLVGSTKPVTAARPRWNREGSKPFTSPHFPFQPDPCSRTARAPRDSGSIASLRRVSNEAAATTNCCPGRMTTR